MFDYQAGEKFKLTLIMTALAGLMAGVFFTLLLMPTPGQPPTRTRVHQAWMENPDVTGRSSGGSGLPGYGSAAEASAKAGTPTNNLVDPNTAQTLIEQWLPLAWDLSAGSAKVSQEKAILYMTPECATAYRQNIWTPTIAQQIEESGIQSRFTTSRVYPGVAHNDGSILICVEGEQVLSVPNKGAKTRPVHLEYLVRNTPSGLRIAGISEAGKSG